MAHLVVCVMNQAQYCPELLTVWTKAGAPGVTIVESSGIQPRTAGVADDIPLFPSIRDMMEKGEMHHRTIFSVVPDEATVDRIVEATEGILGDLCSPGRGILFVMPVSRAIGFSSSVD